MRSRSKSVTLRDVAEAVGINISTASRALDSRTTHRVSDGLRSKVRDAAARLGYQPNAAAYTLKTNRTRTIGVVIPDITDPVFPPIIRGIEAGLEQHGYVAVLANTDGDSEREVRLIETLAARGVDGFILASVQRRKPAPSVLLDNYPVVTVSRVGASVAFSTVTHDEHDGVRRLVTHLSALGHHSFAAIAGPQSVSTGYERLRGFRNALAGLGKRLDEPKIALASRFTEEEGERRAEELLATGRAFTALVCANDRLAIGAIAALARNGLRCPDDVSVTGFNDMPFASRLQPALTTVRLQHDRAGCEAAKMIVSVLEGAAESPRHLVLPVDIVIRSSTALCRRSPASPSSPGTVHDKTTGAAYDRQQMRRRQTAGTAS